MFLYRLTLFDRWGNPVSELDYQSRDDETARKHIPCEMPFGAELRRDGRMVAKYGFSPWGDPPETGRMQDRASGLSTR